MEQDLAQLRERGCWMVFAPTVEEMYPAGHETIVDVGSIRKPLEGVARPRHFFGVATVVLKLLNMVPVDRAYFGQKDYQQTLVVRKLASDLNVPTEIRVCPIVREVDGLAMSSRNAYLSSQGRRQALALSQSLELAKEMHAAGEADVARLRAKILEHIQTVGGGEVEYIAFVAAGTVDEVERIDGPTVIVLAGRVENTRLLDNCQIGD
jgi:pantoate--beta-alanine ligase